VPWLAHATVLPAEDSLMLERYRTTSRYNIRIVVPLTTRIANFDPLGNEEDVELLS